MGIVEFVAANTEKVAKDLLKAVEGLPEHARAWQPLNKGRSALDQLAEVAILNGYTANTIKTLAFEPSYMQGFVEKKADLAEDWARLTALYQENLAVILAAIRGSDELQFNTSIAMPWGPMPLSEIISYPCWNMTYHEGQVNYIRFLSESG